VNYHTRELRIEVPESGRVTGLLRTAPGARVLLALGHGAGAGMRHAFMETVADLLAERGVVTLRYQFPYMEAGARRPDRPPIAHATVRAATAAAVEVAAEISGAGADPLPVFAGGKSFGSRMTSGAAAESPLPGVHGLVFLGFPLHPAGRPGADRADHLAAVGVPMLFVQGTRDRLADLDLLRPVLSDLGPRATLHVVEGADHSFHVLKRSGRTDAEALRELADAVESWSRDVGGS
jgi:predicted alpha/beta-hydrolase family hydrolase